MRPDRSRLRAALALAAVVAGLALVPAVVAGVAVHAFRDGYEPYGPVPVIGPLVGTALGAVGAVFSVALATGLLALVVVLAALAARPWRKRREEGDGPSRDLP